MQYLTKIDSIFLGLRFLVAIPAGLYCANLEDPELFRIFAFILVFYIIYSLSIGLVIRFKGILKETIYRIAAYVDILLLLLAFYLDTYLKFVLIDGFYIIITIHSLYFGFRFSVVLLAFALSGYFLISGSAIFRTDILATAIQLGLSIALPLLVGYLSDNYKRMNQTIERLNQELTRENTKQEKLIRHYRAKNDLIYSLYYFSKMIASTVDIREVFDNFFKFIREKLGNKGLVYLIKKDEESQKSWQITKELDPAKTENYSCFGIALAGKIAEKGRNEFLFNQQLREGKFCIFSHEGLRYHCQEECVFQQGHIHNLDGNDKIIIPIIVNQSVYGAILIFLFEGMDINPGELSFFNSITNQLSIALDRALAFKKLKTTSEIDILTGVFNRGKLIEISQTYIEQSRQTESPVSIIFVDLDHFKNINDQYGHQTGDMVLYEVAQMFENSIRNKDICGRYGGEEFVITLPDASKENAVKIAEKLRLKAMDIVIAANNGDPAGKLTISCGVSSFPEDAGNLEEAIRLADEALLQAKNSGRNKVVAWGTFEKP
jgi:diguanylate cyclase (GGDEF)-like protein